MQGKSMQKTRLATLAPGEGVQPEKEEEEDNQILNIHNDCTQL